MLLTLLLHDQVMLLTVLLHDQVMLIKVLLHDQVLLITLLLHDQVMLITLLLHDQIMLITLLLHDQVMLLTSVIQLLPNIIFCLPFRSVELGYGAILELVVTGAYMSTLGLLRSPRDEASQRLMFLSDSANPCSLSNAGHARKKV